MGQDKEEYEVGIPLDDLSKSADSDEPDEAENEVAVDAAASEDAEDVGLPSLFDEDELAEVGLKAAPFDDADDFATEEPDQPVGVPARDPEHAAEEASAPVTTDMPSEESFEELPAIGELTSDLDETESAREEMAAAAAQEVETAGRSVDPLIVQPETATLQQELGVIQGQLAELKDEFVGKLKYDGHKDKIIDKLHQELQEYKQDIVKKHILSIVLDVVKVADDIRKWLTYFRSLDVSQRDPVKLFRYLEAIPSDLEDIFYWQGVKPYTSTDGEFNPAKQRAIKKIPTDDITKDKTVAKSLRPGYEWEDKIIRQEMVAVYVYEEETESVDTRDIDE